MKPGYISKIIKMLILSLVAMTFIFFAVSRSSVDAAAAQFSLSAIPVVGHEVAYDAGSTAYASTPTEFSTAYNNTAIHRIILSNDLSFTNAEALVVYNKILDRDLQIEGDGHKIIIQNLAGYNVFFRLSSATAPRTLHLRNITFEKLNNPTGDILLYGGNVQWDFIFDNLTIDNGMKFAWIMVSGANIDLFLRNNVSVHMFNDDFVQGVEDVIFEPYSNVSLGKPADGAAVFYDDSSPYDSIAFFGNNCVADIEGSNSFPVFYPWKQIDVYPGADVTLRKVVDGEGVMDSYAVNQIIRIDGGANFKMINNSGPAYYDQANQVTILSNPGANLQFIGNYGAYGGAFVFANANSKMILNAPAYYDLRNNNNTIPALGYTGGATSNLIFQILDSNIAVWKTGTSVTGAPTPPSPFLNVTMQANSGGPLGASSAIINTMTGGWKTAEYARVAFATIPTLNVGDVTMFVGEQKNLNASASPGSATISYVALDPAIATVDASGNVTGVSAGTARITVTATSIENVPASKEVLVTVKTNTPPTLSVPSFTEVAVDGVFDPLTGVTATDLEDGDLLGILDISGTADINVAGIYPVNYSVTDSDGNTVDALQVVLVNDGSFVVGSNYILKASPFTLRPSEVDNSLEGITRDAAVEVFELSTGAQVAQPIQIDDLGGYQPSVGNYSISISVQGDPLAKTTVSGAVVAGESPTISVPGFTTLNVGEGFDPLTGVTASDLEDGDLIGSVNVTGVVDSGTAGVYVLTYALTDSDGNSVAGRQVVLVNDGSFSVGDSFILEALDFSIRPSLVDTSLVGVSREAGIKVYDLTTGDLLVHPVQIDDLGGYQPSEGSYDITVSVVDDSAASRVIKATVIVGEAPTLGILSFTEVALNGTFDPLNGLSAIDLEDGDITSNVEVSGSVDVDTAGIYKLSYSIVDDDGNTVVKSAVVLVNDGSFSAGSSFILEASNFTLRVGEVDSSLAGITSDAQVRVYDLATGEPSAETVQIDNYGGYQAVVGGYTIILRITADLTASRTITATVVSGDSPDLAVPSFTELTVGGSFDPMTGVTASDTEDGNLLSFVALDGDVDVNTPGVYKIDYSVTDSDSNTALATQVVLVNDGSFSVGDTYILMATDFSLRVSQVNTGVAYIDAASSATIYELATGSPVGESIEIIDLGGYQAVVGSYDIVLGVAGDGTLSRGITATVLAGEKPDLSVPSFTELAVGAAFDPLDDVTASDAEDGDLISAVSATGSFDPDTAGMYKISYLVTDVDGNIATADRVILVNDGSFVVGSTYIITASNFTVRLGQVDASLAGVGEDAKVTVYDIATGEVSAQEFQIDDLGGYQAAVGEYSVTLSVVDDPIASRLVVATVITGDSPNLVVPAFREITIGSSFDSTVGLSATDNEDGDLLAEVDITGSIDPDTAGVYQLSYLVVDSDGNIATAEQVVLVNDGTFVVGSTYILSAEDFTLRIGQVDPSLEGVVASSSAQVYDLATGEVSAQSIQIDDLGGYQGVAGQYNIVLRVVDDPAASRTVIATVITGNPPSLTAPTFTEVALGQSFDPMTGVTASDQEDGDLLAEVLVTNPVDINLAGLYKVKYEVSDDEGNIITAEQLVLVNDGSFAVGDTYILEATDFTVYIGKVDLSTPAIISASTATVYDLATGDVLTQDIEITDLGGYAATVGSYDITLRIIDDPAATLTITSTVIQGEAPFMTVPAFTEVAVGGTFDPMAGVTATDTEDGDLLAEVVVNENIDLNTAGVYTLDYSLTDSDGNTISGQQVLLVNDGRFTIGGNSILEASNFTLRVGEVDSSLAGVSASASVTIYNLATGEVSAQSIQIDDLGGYQAVVGSYDITISVTGDPAASRTVTATVVSGELPTLTVPAFTEVAVGAAFNPMTGVTATDTEDGDLLADVQVTETMDLDTSAVYQIDYLVTDSDGNTASGRQVLVVNDGRFAVGSSYILDAQNFTLRVGDVDTSLVGVTSASTAVVYDLATGDVSAQTIQIDDLGGYQAVVDSYDISLSVTGDPAASRVITATVISGDNPDLTVPAFTELTLGGVFDPLTGVTATDTEDGDLAGKLQVSGSVDVNTAGVYRLDYTVTDNDNNTATGQQVILVNDGSFVAGDNYILVAQDFALRTGEVDNSPAGVIASASAIVYDLVSGAVSAQPIEITDLGGYEATADSYNITLQVTDDPAATKTIIATVTTGDIPLLNVPAFTEVAIGGAFDPMTGVTASDTEDGDLVADVVVNESLDLNTAGIYQLDYSIEDTDGNTASGQQIVLVNDGRFIVGSAYILDASDFTLRVGEVDSSLAGVTASAVVKVYDLTTGEVSAQSIQIDDLGGYQAAVGSYDITISVTGDPAASRTVTANVVGGELPTLTAPSFTEVAVGATFDPMTGVTASDPEDGDLLAEVQVTEAIALDTAAVYQIDYLVTDSDGNTASGRQVLVVNDGRFAIGSSYILDASNFTLRVGEVDSSLPGVTAASAAVVYDLATGDVSVQTIQIDDLGGYQAAVASYDITISVTGDPAASRVVTAVVVSGDDPDLTVPAFTEVTLNGSFSAFTSVIATDTEDGDLIGNLQISGAVDVNATGVYRLDYTVTDSDNNTATGQQVVLVNDGSFVVGDDYILVAQNFTLRTGDVDNSLIGVVTSASATVYDLASGAVSTQPIEITDLGGYEATAGSYDITLQVTEDSAAGKTITATVTNGYPPVLSVPAFTEVAAGGVFDPMTGVTATDTEDGDLLATVVVNESVDLNTAGIYRLDYSVEDGDGNVASGQQVLLVNDGRFIAGSYYILDASDFTLRVGEVDSSLAGVTASSAVNVYDLTTGEVSAQSIQIDDLGGYQAAVGSYDITISVTGDPAASRTVTATVVSGELPTLTVPAFTEVAVGAAFNPMTGVTATDTEDGDLLADVQVTEAIDLDTSAVYQIDYLVTDSDGNTASGRQVLLVNDGRFAVGSSYILDAQDFTLRISEADSSLAGVTTASTAVVYDLATGDVSAQTIQIDDLGGYQAVVGSYDISLSVTGDPAASRVITATVISGDNPDLTVPAFTELTLGGVFDSLTGVTATDTEDGDLAGKLQVSGSVDVNTAGVYRLDYTVTDNDNNTVTGQQVVLVNDGSFVIGSTYMIKANSFVVDLGDVDTSNAAILTSTGVRVFSMATGLEESKPVNIDDLGGYQAAVGEYTITLSVAEDSTAKISIQATVQRGEPPVISGVSFVELAIDVAFDPMAGITASDPEDGDITAEISVSGSVDTTQAAVYRLIYGVTDSDGNSISQERVVLVNDGSFVVGTNYILEATDFVIRIGQVEVSDAAIIKEAQGKVYLLSSGLEQADALAVTDDGGYQAVVGDYSISLQVINEPLLSKSITASVVAGESPSLTVPSFTEISAGNDFDPMSDVTAVDPEDGDIVSKVTTADSAPMGGSGVFRIDYQVTDSDGNTTDASRVVLVNDGTYTVGTSFILRATDFTRILESVNTEEDAVLLDSKAEAFDLLTGELSTEPIEITDAGGYTAALGTYDISLRVASDPAAATTIRATVVSGEPPQIILEPFTEIILGAGFDPLANVQATDPESGDLTAQLVVEGEVDTMTSGLYTLTYSVTDEAGNETRVKRVVLVNDGSFNIGNRFIIKAYDFSKRVRDVDTSTQAIVLASQAVVFDKATGEKVEQEISVIDLGGYQPSEGVFLLTLAVTIDTSSQRNITATVVGGISPLLTVPAFTELMVGAEFDSLTEIKATDAEDGDLTGLIQIDGVVNNKQAGVYSLLYWVEDADGNRSESVRVVLVNDGTFSANDQYIIQARGFKIEKSKAEISDQAMKELAQVKVFAIRENQFIEAPEITVDRTYYRLTVGQYPITFGYNPEVTVQVSVTEDSWLTKTGEDSNTLTIIIGTSLLAASILLLGYRKREYKKSSQEK